VRRGRCRDRCRRSHDRRRAQRASIRRRARTRSASPTAPTRTSESAAADNARTRHASGEGEPARRRVAIRTSAASSPADPAAAATSAAASENAMSVGSSRSSAPVPKATARARSPCHLSTAERTARTRPFDFVGRAACLRAIGASDRGPKSPLRSVSSAARAYTTRRVRDRRRARGAPRRGAGRRPRRCLRRKLPRDARVARRFR